MSTSSLDNFRRAAASKLDEFMIELRERLLAAPAIHVDETGMKVSGKRHWVHVVSNKIYSFFDLHAKRGKQAHEQMDLLAHYSGILHRDDYVSYRDYQKAVHSLCCAHLLRDLIFLRDHVANCEWSKEMIALLLEIKAACEEKQSNRVSKNKQKDYLAAYRQIIERGLDAHPPALKSNKALRGISAQTKPVNLLLRLQKNEAAVLRFMTEEQAHFDNNQAERDLRMNKVRQKVSGGFRSPNAAREFMRVRSFIATAIKQGKDPIEVLTQLFQNDKEKFLALVAP